MLDRGDRRAVDDESRAALERSVLGRGVYVSGNLHPIFAVPDAEPDPRVGFGRDEAKAREFSGVDPHTLIHGFGF
jgi:hypothetical protein